MQVNTEIIKTVTYNERAAKYKVNFVRYADDFIITAKTEEVAKQVKKLIKDFLNERGLQLSDEKTRITHIDSGFDFLGGNLLFFITIDE